MATKQIREVLDAGKYIHAELQRMVSEQQSETPDEMYTVLLEYLQKREQEMQMMMSAIPSGHREKILNTFVRYYPQEDEDEAIRAIEECKIENPDKPVGCLVEARKHLVKIYDFCASSAHIPETEEFMRSVQVFENKQLQELNRQLSEFQTEVQSLV